jgi:hypothetical protein
MSSRYTSVRIQRSTKTWLDFLRGDDYSLDEIVDILVKDFIDDDDSDDNDQMSLMDYDDDDD